MAVKTFDAPITTNDQSIDRVLNAGLPVLLVATSGKLKRRVQNTLNKLAKDHAGALLVAKFQTDESPQSTTRLNVDGGGVLSFENGKEVARTPGIPDNAALKAHVSHLLGGAPAPSAGGAAPDYDTGEPFPVTDATFERDVLQSDLPVLVDFWAPWCGPCRMIAPVLEKLSGEYAGKLRVAKVNTDENPRWANQFGVRGIPTLLLVHGGQVVDRLVGVQPEPMLRAAIDKALLLN